MGDRGTIPVLQNECCPCIFIAVEALAYEALVTPGQHMRLAAGG